MGQLCEKSVYIAVRDEAKEGRSDARSQAR